MQLPLTTTQGFCFKVRYIYFTAVVKSVLNLCVLAQFSEWEHSERRSNRIRTTLTAERSVRRWSLGDSIVVAGATGLCWGLYGVLVSLVFWSLWCFGLYGFLVSMVFCFFLTKPRSDIHPYSWTASMQSFDYPPRRNRPFPPAIFRVKIGPYVVPLLMRSPIELMPWDFPSRCSPHVRPRPLCC